MLLGRVDHTSQATVTVRVPKLVSVLVRDPFERQVSPTRVSVIQDGEKPSSWVSLPVAWPSRDGGFSRWLKLATSGTFSS